MDLEKTKLLSLVISISLLGVVPLTASSQSSQSGVGGTTTINDDTAIGNTNENYQAISSEATTSSDSSSESTLAEGIAADRKATAEELHAIQRIEKNVVWEDCRGFKKRLDKELGGIGALTPNGETKYSGGITEKIYPFEYRARQGSYVTWEPIIESNIITANRVVGNEVKTVVIVPFKLKFQISMNSYGLFWEHPESKLSPTKEMYQEFLNAVAIHEARHREDMAKVIEKYNQMYGKLDYAWGLGADQTEARNNAYQMLRDKFANELSNKFKNPIDKEIKDKEKAFHDYEVIHGKRKFVWSCPQAMAPEVQSIQTNSTEPASTLPEPTPQCDPSYPDDCVSPLPPDLNCGDEGVPWEFTVLQPDPHGFDDNYDGVGCETELSEQTETELTEGEDVSSLDYYPAEEADITADETATEEEDDELTDEEDNTSLEYYPAEGDDDINPDETIAEEEEE